MENQNLNTSSFPSIKAWLQLMRLPAVCTAVSNVATGFFAVSQPSYAWDKLALLCASSTCLYTAGMVLNDYADRSVDAVERPDRPIPSGRVSPQTAKILGLSLLLFGLVFAIRDGLAIAVALSAGILGYNFTIRSAWLLAGCRFLNVSLGGFWAVQEEFFQGTGSFSRGLLPICATVVSLWTLAIMSLSQREVQRPHYQKVVKAMLLGFIVLDAIFVAFLAGWLYGLVVLSLLIPSVLLARWIYIT